MMSMTRHALARSATISAGAAIAVPRKTRLACSSMAALQHSRLGAVAYGRICPVHVWPVLRCPPRLGGPREIHAWIVVKVALDRHLYRWKFGVIRIQHCVPLLRD